MNRLFLRIAIEFENLKWDGSFRYFECGTQIIMMTR
jgi:hypothetical protein